LALRIALQFTPNHAHLWAALTRVLLRTGNLKSASDAIKKAKDLDPDSSEVLALEAQILQSEENSPAVRPLAAFRGSPTAPTWLGGTWEIPRELIVNLSLSASDAAEGVVKDIGFKRTVLCHRCRGKGAEPGTAAEDCPRCEGEGRLFSGEDSGIRKRIEFSICPDCQGTGSTFTTPCTECSGSGRIVEDKILQLAIPADVQEGTCLKVSHAGNQAFQFEHPGDLIIQIHTRARGRRKLYSNLSN